MADALLKSVVGQERLAPVDAVRHGGDLAAHDPLGPVHDVGHVTVERLAPVAAKHFENPPLAHVAGARAGLGVLGHDVEAGVGENHVPHVAPQLPGLPHFERRDAQPLVPDFGCLGVVSTRGAPAQVRLVGLTGGPGDKFILEEDGLEHAQVVDLVAAEVNVVVKNHVSGPDIVLEIFDARLERWLEGEPQESGVFGLLEHVAVGPVNPGGEVPALGKNGRSGGVEQGERHLLGDGAEAPLENGGEDGIDARGAGDGTHIQVASPVGMNLARISSARAAGQMKLWPNAPRASS